MQQFAGIEPHSKDMLTTRMTLKHWSGKEPYQSNHNQNIELTWANSFSISPARMTSGPRTAYSMVMKCGLMFSSWRHLVDIFAFCCGDEMAESPEFERAAVMKCLFLCGDDKARPTAPVDDKTLTKRLISGRKENNEFKAFFSNQ